MPRVLRIMNRMSIGGPVLNALLLTRYMAPEFETLFVVGEKEDHEKSAEFLAVEMNITPTYIPEMGRSVSPLQDYKAYRKLKKIIKEFKPDIVHTHAAKPGALGRLAARSMKVPVIIHTYHGHVFHSYFGKLKTKIYILIERFLARRSDAIVAISDQQKNELARDFKIAPPDKFHVIPLGFNLDKFTRNQQEKRNSFRMEFGLEDDEIAIGIIGRLVPVKNHALFLDAIAYVMKNTSNRIRAFIIGDGETRQALEARARELGIAYTTEKDTSHPSTLIFTSWRSDVDVINAGLDIIALTSFNEGTPVSLIEAQAAGKPVVSTRVGGIQDVVAEGDTALLSGINDTTRFFENLLSLTENAELRSNLGKNGPTLVLQKFSYQRLVRDMTSLYRELLKGKTKQANWSVGKGEGDW